MTVCYSRVFLCCYCFGCYCQFPWYFCWKKEKIPRSVSKLHEMRKSCLGTRGSLLSRKVNSCWPSNGTFDESFTFGNCRVVQPRKCRGHSHNGRIWSCLKGRKLSTNGLKSQRNKLIATFTLTTYRLFESIIFLITNWQQEKEHSKVTHWKVCKCFAVR